MKRYLLVGLWATLASLAFVSCSDDDDNPAGGGGENTHQPAIQIESVTPANNSVNIVFKVQDAKRAVYKVMSASAEKPSAQALLADDSAVELNVAGGTVQKSGLEGNTDYVVVAAASYDENVSNLASKDFKTEPNTITETYKFAQGGYNGKNEAETVANYEIKLTTLPYGDEDTYPRKEVYIALTGDAAQVDLKNLAIPTGTYTLGNSDTPEAGKFYPGILTGEEIGGSFAVTMQSKESEPIIELIKSGEVVVAETDAANKKYKVQLHVVLEDGTKLEGTYENGALVVDNNSGELPPSEELPLPESPLEGDVTGLTIKEAFYTYHGPTRYGDFGKDEIYLQLYIDNTNYSEYVDIFLLADYTKYPGSDMKLPVGTYPVKPWYNSRSSELCAITGYRVAGQGVGGSIDLGCVYTMQFTKKAYIMGGNVTVESFDPATKNVKLQFEFQDAKGHTISGAYEGRLQ